MSLKNSQERPPKHKLIVSLHKDEQIFSVPVWGNSAPHVWILRVWPPSVPFIMTSEGAIREEAEEEKAEQIDQHLRQNWWKDGKNWRDRLRLGGGGHETEGDEEEEAKCWAGVEEWMMRKLEKKMATLTKKYMKLQIEVLSKTHWGLLIIRTMNGGLDGRWQTNTSQRSQTHCGYHSLMEHERKAFFIYCILCCSITINQVHDLV